MNSKITLYLLFSFHYAAMQELGSPQGELPGAHAHDHSLVIKLLTVGIVLLITLIIQSNKKLAEEQVSSPSDIMKNAETQTEDSTIF